MEPITLHAVIPHHTPLSNHVGELHALHEDFQFPSALYSESEHDHLKWKQASFVIIEMDHEEKAIFT